jgi:hypothetical protein
MSRLVSAAPALLRSLMLPVLAPVVGVAVVVLGIMALDRAARQQLHGSGRNEIAFGDVRCAPPEGLSHEDFLGEVQYLAHLPDRIDRMEPGLVDRLRRAFALHPWVEEVERIEVPPGEPIAAELRYRRPVLTVQLGDRRRVIDASGILLPESASAQSLIAYRSPVRPPHGRAGTAWGDERLAGAARAAALVAPDRERLGLVQVEWTARGLVFGTARGSTVLWGQPPGAEAEREALAARKRERLLRWCEQHGSLDSPHPPCEHDVRPADQ